MKKGFTLAELLGIIVILAVIALIAFPIIASSIRNSRIDSYEANKKIIVEAAKNWAVENSDKLPSVGSNNTTSVTIPDLINSGYITKTDNGKLINPIDDTEMTGCVLITYNSAYNQYMYEYSDGCEVPPTLIETLLKQYSEGNTIGLVKDTNNPNLYYYVGSNNEVTNNYLWYGGHHWRVVEIDTNANTLLLVSQQPLTSIQPASTPWDTQEEYKNSYINTWLNDYFYNSLDSEIQNNIVNNTFNVGIYNNVDEITMTQKVGLLDNDQYERAGGENSYLDIKDHFWLGNRYSSSDVRAVNSHGYLDNNSPLNAFGVRAVIKISDITITEGDGTLSSNYKTADKATSTNDVQVGEYINVPYSGSDNACGDDNLCTFRVVSKDNDSIKVVLNGLLPNKSKYGDTVTITTNHTIYTPLSEIVNNISSNYRYTGNKTFYIGDYPNGANYTNVQGETLSASVGLPTVGEMFSGNDIDLSTSSNKTFVDVNTIENPAVSEYYWTMNRYSSSYVHIVNSNGYLNNVSPSNTFGVRAVIYLKSGTSALTFTGGEGTAESPYGLQ